LLLPISSENNQDNSVSSHSRAASDQDIEGRLDLPPSSLGFAEPTADLGPVAGLGDHLRMQQVSRNQASMTVEADNSQDAGILVNPETFKTPSKKLVIRAEDVELSSFSAATGSKI